MAKRSNGTTQKSRIPPEASETVQKEAPSTAGWMLVKPMPLSAWIRVFHGFTDCEIVEIVSGERPFSVTAKSSLGHTKRIVIPEYLSLVSPRFGDEEWICSSELAPEFDRLDDDICDAEGRANDWFRQDCRILSPS